MKSLHTHRPALLMLAFLGSSCAPVGPDYKPPSAQILSQWMEFEDPRLATTPPVGPRWWEQAFGDPVLDHLVNEALQGSLTLRSAALRVVQAQQQLLIVNSTLFPQEQFLGGSAASVDPGPGGGPSGIYSFNANLAWEVDVWGRFRRQIESASASYDATLSSYDGVLVLLVSNVAQTYLLIRTTEQRLIVAAQNIDLQTESLRVSQAKFDAGDTSILDVEQGQTLLYNTRASASALQQSLRQLKIALAILLGQLPQDLTEQLREPGPIPTVSVGVAVGMPQDLIRRRPDIRVAERQLAAQSAQIGVAVSDLYPQIGLTGSIGPTVSTSNGQDFADLFNRDNIAHTLGVGFRWDVLNYGRFTNNIRLQDATFQQLLEDYRQTVLQAQAEVESSLVAFAQTSVQLRELNEAAEAAQRAAVVATAQYEEGLVDYNTVVGVLRTLASQQDQLALIRGTVAINLVEVYRSLGGGWEIRQNNRAADLLPEVTRQEMIGRSKYWKKDLKGK